MFGKKYYHGLIRKYVIYFGNLFNDIEFDRVDSSGDVVQTLRVPISYSAKEPYMAKLEAVGENNEQPLATRLPRMSFEITGYEYDTTRRLSAVRKVCVTDENGNPKEIWTPHPININFQLYIYVRNVDDGLRIIEQILPFFTPDFTASLKLLKDSGVDQSWDVPLTYLDWNTEDNYEGALYDRRMIIHTLDFQLKGYLFNEVPTDSAGLIRKAITAFHEGTREDGRFDPDVTVTITPGLTSNGEPTSNGSLSIDINDIDPDDNWTHVIEYE